MSPCVTVSPRSHPVWTEWLLCWLHVPRVPLTAALSLGTLLVPAGLQWGTLGCSAAWEGNRDPKGLHPAHSWSGQGPVGSGTPSSLPALTRALLSSLLSPQGCLLQRWLHSEPGACRKHPLLAGLVRGLVVPDGCQRGREPLGAVHREPQHPGPEVRGCHGHGGQQQPGGSPTQLSSGETTGSGCQLQRIAMWGGDEKPAPCGEVRALRALGARWAGAA